MGNEREGGCDYAFSGVPAGAGVALKSCQLYILHKNRSGIMYISPN